MEFNTDYDRIISGQIHHMIFHQLKDKIDNKILTLDLKGFITEEPVKYEDRLKYPLELFSINETWSNKLFACGWLNLKGVINKNIDEKLYLKLDISGEACLFDNEGVPIKGFTNGSSVFDRAHGEPGKLYYEITNLIDESGNVDLWVEMGMNDLFGNVQDNGKILHAEIVTINNEILELFYDLEVIYSIVEGTKESNRYTESLFEELKKVLVLVIYNEKDWIKKAKTITNEILSKKTNNKLKFTAVGHAHLDLAWLWPIRETRRKAGRTMANMIDLLENHDDFIFGISQPQQLVWLEEDYPELFEKIVKYINNGRIELQGGMWVESDTNVPSEESLVRQMLYGIKYYQDKFNYRVRNLWLPDVFGYNGNLPQIIKKSGLNYFMTIKLTWSLINKFPHQSFNWFGIDGTNVLTHMPPEGNYNSAISPKKVLEAENKYNEKEIFNEGLKLFGIGNGGGGPGYEHLARIDRMKDLNPLPKVSYGRADEFFPKMQEVEEKLPKYFGELYLENHQGTYTSQSEVKRYNTMLEQKLKTLEIVFASKDVLEKYQSKIDEIWKEVLLYQFHDIIPGSSIKRVYDECLARYEIINNELDKIIEKQNYRINPNEHDLLLNPFNFKVENLVKVKNKYHLYHANPFETSGKPLVYKSEEKFLDQYNFNLDKLIISFDEKTGFIKRIFHKETNREVLRNKGNQLLVFKDLGNGWDISDHYREQTPEIPKLKNRVVNNYDRFIEVVNNYKFMDSTIEEKIIIDTKTTKITFSHKVDWQNVGYMLRTEFDGEIESDEAIFDIQFGEITRKRTNNNSLESAQFEMPGQQWVSVHDGNLGFSLLTKGKYGFYVKENIVDLNLLRSTNYPCVNGDIGKTEYSYQIIIHKDDHLTANIDQEAMIFNGFYLYTENEEKIDLNISWDNDEVLISAYKDGYDGNSKILRIYNPTSKIQKTTLTTNLNIFETNLVEEQINKLSDKMLKFSPFEVKTFKLI